MLSLRPRIQPNRQRPPQLTRPVSPTPDDQRRPPEPPREDEPPRVALIPASFKSEWVPNPRWTIQQLLDTILPPPADPRTITISPTFSPRGPTELDSAMCTVPVPPLTYVVILRDRAIRAIREGNRSVLSPYGDGRRYPLWTPTYWSEIAHVVEICAQYHEARNWLNAARVSRRADGELIPRIFDDWKKQPWSDLHRDLKADDPTAHLPQPDRLLPIISDRWLEDDQMDLLIRLTSVSVREQKKSGIVVPLRFWRELEHLDMNNGFFDSGHYPCLTDTWSQVSRGNLDLGFIVNNADGHMPGDKGTHWSAAVLSLSKGEFRYGDSLGRPPPLAFQGRLERWLRMYDPSGRRLQKGKDLKHATQTDGHSCGLISINSLEHYFLRYPLWTPETDADIRLSKYINLLEYNRGPPVGISPLCSYSVLSSLATT
ncbi:hypothetical protein BS47DRAFT_611339 [Hydnum rufescens UP504]|uniref:Ubiquitin-like protease family profile domain-containing protein n=1 Tax=Hydnum rufescens UP504 TaxID=1448309 RepID=A0A9P6DZC1_9AGAM|nr:hypothetical protein BS47DRAFT_611339 [Hydnum rufescens UP504]